MEASADDGRSQPGHDPRVEAFARWVIGHRWFSSFAITSQTGMMSAMIIAIALICELFLVPPLLLSLRLVDA